jgi:hypothetical protein
MFNWVKRRLEITAVNGAVEDLQRCILGLKGASDQEVGMAVANATVIRLNFRAGGKLPDVVLDLSVRRDDEIRKICDFTQLNLSEAVKYFQKMNQGGDAFGVMIWLHSVRALNIPEVRLFGRQMWRELQRGFPFASAALDDLRLITRKPFPIGTEEQLTFIPRGLEPDGT